MPNATSAVPAATPVGNPNLMARPTTGRTVISMKSSPVPESKPVPQKTETAPVEKITAKTSKLPDPAPAEPVEQTPKRKIKVNGKEVEVTEAELETAYGKSKASQELFEKAAKKQKEVEAGLETLATDPLKGFEMLGIDPMVLVKKLQEAAEIDAKRKSELAKMTPEQRRLAELTEENTRLKSEKETAETQRQETEKTQKSKVTQQKAVKAIQDVCDQLKLPKNKEGMLFAAELIRDALGKDDESGLDGLADGKVPVKKLMENAKARTLKYLKWASNEYNPEQLAALLPPEVIASIRGAA